MSPTCVSENFPCGDGVRTTSSISNRDAIHHHLVERWLRERFVVLRQDSVPPPLVSPHKDTQTDRDHDHSIGDQKSMVLFSDTLVSHKLRSAIIGHTPPHHHRADQACVLSYRVAFGDHTNAQQRSPPRSVVVAVDGSPWFPGSDPRDPHHTVAATIVCDDDDDDDSSASSWAIRRTFSFDDRLPIVHTDPRTASFGTANDDVWAE